MQSRKINFETIIWLVAISIFILGLIIFISLVHVKNWLWLGWIYGFGTFSLGYLFGIFIIKYLLKKAKSKKIGIFLSFGRTFLNYILQIGFLIILIMIDNYYNSSPLLSKKYSLHDIVEGPINIFTYIASVSLVMFSTIFSLFIKNKKGKEGFSETICR